MSNSFPSPSARAWPLMGILLVSLLVLFVILAGCAQNSTNTSPQTPGASVQAQGGTPIPIDSATPSVSPSVNSTSGSPSNAAPVSAAAPVLSNSSFAASDNKTGYDKTKATIAAIVPDGTYENNISYTNPSGTDIADIKISVQGDVITAASVTLNGNPNRISTKLAGNFNDALPALVVGKKINELNIPRNVAGSSLTTAAFKGYVDQLVQNHGAL